MVEIFWSIVIFIFGLIAGSFLNCLIYRLETGRTFLQGRSFCPQCGHTLSWQDLIPVFSFLILKGRCRYCQKPISWQYPLVELATGILFLLCFMFHVLCSMYIITCFLIIIFVYDLKHYLIPDKVIYPAILISLLRLFLLGEDSPLPFLYAGLGAALFFFLIVFVSKGKWMGAGDIKLAFLIGLILGWPKIIVALFLAFFIGAAIGIILIMAGKKGLKSEIPFGPFLVGATFLALFWGERIFNWYLTYFLLK